MMKHLYYCLFTSVFEVSCTVQQDLGIIWSHRISICNLWQVLWFWQWRQSIFQCQCCIMFERKWKLNFCNIFRKPTYAQDECRKLNENAFSPHHSAGRSKPSQPRNLPRVPRNLRMRTGRAPGFCNFTIQLMGSQLMRVWLHCVES